MAFCFKLNTNFRRLILKLIGPFYPFILIIIILNFPIIRLYSIIALSIFAISDSGGFDHRKYSFTLNLYSDVI